MRTEVDYLLEHGLAKLSCSPWSSPCLLVQKSDGSARFCTDYRKSFLWSDECQYAFNSIKAPLCSTPDHSISYFSRKFNKHQLNYLTIEKEALAPLMALQNFEVNVGSSNIPVTCSLIITLYFFLSQMHNQNQHLMRWSLIVQGYNLIIKHKRVWKT